MSFEQKLLDALKAERNMDLWIALTNEIHEFEVNGGDLSDREEYLWLALTEKIESNLDY